MWTLGRGNRQDKAGDAHPPVYPVWYLTLLAAAYRDAGDLHKSIAAALEGIRLQPNDNDARPVLCSAYMLNSEQIHAKHTAEEILAIEQMFSVASYVYSQPYREEAAISRLMDALRQAGLPS